jgi:hypothetical protein
MGSDALNDEFSLNIKTLYGFWRCHQAVTEK